VLSEIRIYFEGDRSLRPGFAAFFRDLKSEAAKRRCRLVLIAAGGNPEDDFRTALEMHSTAWNIMLRDSEGPYNSSLLAGWNPSLAESIFWMVEAMEAWFHADKDALQRYYQSGFRRNALRANPRVEEIRKRDLLDGLHAATKDTTKGRYHKTKHAPALLEYIDPTLVRRAAPNCNRLFDAILARLTTTDA